MTFPHSATIKRKTQTGNKFAFADNGSTQCFLQPLDDQHAQIYGMTFGKGYHCYVPSSTDVREGDRMTIDSVQYGVRGLKDHNYGNLTHKRVMLERL